MSLQQFLQIDVGIVMIIVAVLAIESKKVITSVIYLSVLSLLAVVGFALMNAPDVAVTEAVIGSGLVTALFVFTLIGIKKSTDTKADTLDSLDIHGNDSNNTLVEGGDSKWKK